MELGPASLTQIKIASKNNFLECILTSIREAEF